MNSETFFSRIHCHDFSTGGVGNDGGQYRAPSRDVEKDVFSLEATLGGHAGKGVRELKILQEEPLD
jgi:hypothetical protein